VRAIVCYLFRAEGDQQKTEDNRMILNWLVVIGVLLLCVIAYGIMEYLNRVKRVYYFYNKKKITKKTTR